jgi:hypothetical protein
MADQETFLPSVSQLYLFNERGPREKIFVP